MARKSNLVKIYMLMLKLEYLLDSENQKRKREDKAIKRAWGYAFNIKGLLIKEVGYWQTTLPTISKSIVSLKKDCPKWTRRIKQLRKDVRR